MRVRPTDKQIQNLQKLTNDELLQKSLECMHSLNRRAKEKRDRYNYYKIATFSNAIQEEINDIYSLKTEYLDTLVSENLATVERFDYDDTIWYIVSCLGYTFHQPLYTKEPMPFIIADALPGKAHNPTQQQKEIPETGLTIEAQHRCVEMMIERIYEKLTVE